MFNPAAPLDVLEWVIDKVDLVLVMSVNPGFGGQSFIPSALRKIERVRKRIDASGRDIRLEVDGGIKVDNIRAARRRRLPTPSSPAARSSAPGDYRAVIDAMRGAARAADGAPRRRSRWLATTPAADAHGLATADMRTTATTATATRHGHGHGHAHGHSHAPARTSTAPSRSASRINVAFVASRRSTAGAPTRSRCSPMPATTSATSSASSSPGPARSPAGCAPDERHTYGWKRASILAAFANSLLLLVAIGSLAWAAIGRLRRRRRSRPTR